MITFYLWSVIIALIVMIIVIFIDKYGKPKKSTTIRELLLFILVSMIPFGNIILIGFMIQHLIGLSERINKVLDKEI